MTRWIGLGVGVVACWVALSGCGSTQQNPGGNHGGDSGSGMNNDGSPLQDRTILEVRQIMTTKVDVLLSIDNSRSMKDKQDILAQSLPYLVQRLITPRCVRDCEPADNCTVRQQVEGIPLGFLSDPDGNCQGGSAEMTPLRDLHLGVVSSSLGAHGAAAAGDLCVRSSDNDHARLLGSIRPVSGTFKDIGFLAWDTRRVDAEPAADHDLKAFVDKAIQLVQSAGEDGCELEATLEAWYRFLIDPAPPQQIALEDNLARAQGVDSTVLEQRAAFLRPDSAVVIGMLSDENDCSIVDEGYGWLAARMAPMYGSTSQCAVNPNDPCCTSCAAGDAAVGCPPPSSDPSCQATTLPAEADAPGLRCFHQKARFGMDLLYPIARYHDGLTNPVVPDGNGTMVQNPLFAAAEGTLPRDRGLVHLLSIIGVPWQDIADFDSLTGATGLRFMAPAELSSSGRWDVVVGDPSASPPQLPTDPFMLESVDERTGNNPIAQDGIVQSSATSPKANTINGHELKNVTSDELQFACIFPLPTPRDCATAPADVACDCTQTDIAKNSPLCQPPAGGPADTTQYYAQAYPGTRFLELHRQLEDGTVASICPQTLDETSPSYGYIPALDSVVRGVRSITRAKCLPVALPIDDQTGGLAAGCGVITAFARAGDSCGCEGQGWSAITSGTAVERAKQQLALYGLCDLEAAASCSDYCFCHIPEATGFSLLACQSEPQAPAETGFCYVNAQPEEPHVGNPDLLRDCSADAKRLLRFIGNAPPAENRTFVACDQPFIPQRPERGEP